MTRPLTPILLRGALGAVLAAALLAGCGRKGPLEPPPSAQAAAPAQPAARSGGSTTLSRALTKDSTTPKPAPAMNRSGYPIAPPGENKRIPLDWLVD